MIYLLITSIIWAFSFGLIKTHLTSLDSTFVSLIRMVISFLVFLPFLRLKRLSPKLALSFILVGMVQYGIMYIAYIHSYKFLEAYEVAIFTIFTPVYVTIINDLINKKINWIFLATSILAVAGAGVIVHKNANINLVLIGFGLVQISNICFAFGQVVYKRVLEKNAYLKDSQIFGLLYLGAFIITSITAGISVDWQAIDINQSQTLTLIYLGAAASGLGFFLWNYGATKTNTGALAIFNNLKIPFAVTVSILIFNEYADWIKLMLGGIIILIGLILNEYYERKKVKMIKL